MKITPFDIQQQQFRKCFRGFDIREVNAFLERTADLLETLNHKNEILKIENQRLHEEIKGHIDRQQTFKHAMLNGQKVLDQMKENAKKFGEVIIAEAEVTAEKILNKAHNRLAQLHEDISELKRQRIQIEVQIRSVLDAHTKLFELRKEGMKAVDEEESKIKLLKPSR
jgi:cell division initiation protein